jgi:hypothetical protein
MQCLFFVGVIDNRNQGCSAFENKPEPLRGAFCLNQKFTRYNEAYLNVVPKAILQQQILQDLYFPDDFQQ